MELRILACRALSLRLTFPRYLVLELLAGDLATDQPSEDQDSFIGLTSTIPRRLRRSWRAVDLDIDPVAFERHRLRNSLARKGQGPSKNRPVAD